VLRCTCAPDQELPTVGNHGGEEVSSKPELRVSDLELCRSAPSRAPHGRATGAAGWVRSTRIAAAAVRVRTGAHAAAGRSAGHRAPARAHTAAVQTPSRQRVDLQNPVPGGDARARRRRPTDGSPGG
jgi:hypothetical protein